MPIDVYCGSEHLLSISEDALLRLEPSLSELRDRAGRSVDPYGTSTLEPAHAQLWLVGLRRILPNLRGDIVASKACTQLAAVLTDSVARHVTLTFEGD